MFFTEPTLKSKACLRCLYFTKIISALCCYLEYFRIFTPSIKRMTMFKKTDPNPQLDIFTAPSMQSGSLLPRNTELSSDLQYNSW